MTWRGRYASLLYNKIACALILHRAVLSLPMINEHIDLPNSLRVLDGTFLDCPSLERVVIPEGVEEIRNRVFNGCGVRQVELPSTIRVLDDAFFSCKSLEVVQWKKLQSEDMAIKSHTFGYCDNLRQIELPDGIKGIEAGAFTACIYNHRTTKTNQKYPSVNL